MAPPSARQLARVGFSELAVQAIYGLRQGVGLPPPDSTELTRKAIRRVYESQAIVGLMIGVLAVVPIFGLNPTARHLFAPNLPASLFDGTVITAVLVLELTFLWWSSLQMIPAFLSTRFLPLLETLPVDRSTVDRAALLLFLKMFDVPLSVMLVVTPISIGLGLNSVPAGLLAVPGVVECAVVALVVALVTGRFFVRHVQAASGGRAPTILRWLLLILWVAPAFALYAFLTFTFQLLSWMTVFWTAGVQGPLGFVAVAFPYPFGLLPDLAVPATAGLGVVPGLSVVVVLASLAYLALGVYGFRWLIGGVREFARTPSERGKAPDPTTIRLHPGGAAFAVLRKDLRTASRSPGYAFVILLPLLNSVALGFTTVVTHSSGGTALSVALGAVISSALLATFFGPALFALELMGYAYTRTLPLSLRSIFVGKVTLVSALYLASAGIVLGLTLTRLFAPIVFLAFVAAELPAIVAAALAEFGVLAMLARRSGRPIGNLYTEAWSAVLVGIPGLIIAGAPIAVYLGVGRVVAALALPGMGLLALVELGVILPIALAGASRKGM